MGDCVLGIIVAITLIVMGIMMGRDFIHFQVKQEVFPYAEKVCEPLGGLTEVRAGKNNYVIVCTDNELKVAVEKFND